MEPIVPSSPMPFAPSGLSGRRRAGRVELDAREHRSARHRVVHERRGHQLAALVVADLFAHRLAEALDDAAEALAVCEQRVDDVADVVDGDVALERELPVSLSIETVQKCTPNGNVVPVGSKRATASRPGSSPGIAHAPGVRRARDVGEGELACADRRR